MTFALPKTGCCHYDRYCLLEVGLYSSKVNMMKADKQYCHHQFCVILSLDAVIGENNCSRVSINAEQFIY